MTSCERRRTSAYSDDLKSGKEKVLGTATVRLPKTCALMHLL